MGNTTGKNKTHPVSGDEPDYSYEDYGYDYEYDQRNDYDSGVRQRKTVPKYFKIFLLLVAP